MVARGGATGAVSHRGALRPLGIFQRVDKLAGQGRTQLRYLLVTGVADPYGGPAMEVAPPVSRSKSACKWVPQVGINHV